MKKLITLIVISLSINCLFCQNAKRQLPIKIIKNDLFIEVYLNDEGPYNFILDLGASGQGRVDIELARKLKLKVVDSISNFDGNNYSTERVMGVSKLRIGSIEIGDIGLMARDYNRNYKEGNIRTDGIIGRDFFKNYLLTIDCPNETVTISNNSLNESKGKALPYEEAFKVQGKIGGKDITFNIDTGSNMAVHLPKTIMDNLEYENTTNRFIGRRANTEYIIQEAILKSKIQLGDLEVSNQLIGYSIKNTFVNIGMDFLKSYKLSFDQKNKLIKIDN